MLLIVYQAIYQATENLRRLYLLLRIKLGKCEEYYYVKLKYSERTLRDVD
jgi:hypothetical protein